MRLQWLQAAIEDREEIFDYIEADSPQAASDVDLRIRDQAAMLSQFPMAGRSGRVPGTRELVIQHTPYVLIYKQDFDTIRILRVLHGARRWPRLPGLGSSEK